MNTVIRRESQWWWRIFDASVRSGDTMANEVRLRIDGLGLSAKGKRDLRWRLRPAPSTQVKIVSDGDYRNTRILVDDVELQCVTGVTWRIGPQPGLATATLEVIEVAVEVGGELADLQVLKRLRPPTRIGRLRSRLKGRWRDRGYKRAKRKRARERDRRQAGKVGPA